MLKKLKQKSGETLIESLAAVVVMVFVISMLPTAIVTAAKINASVKNMNTTCSETRDLTSGAAVSYASNVKIYGGTVTRDPSGNITSSEGELEGTYNGYFEDGFYYYVK